MRNKQLFRSSGNPLQGCLLGEKWEKVPSLQITQPIDKDIKIYGIGGIEIIFIQKCLS